MNNKLKLLVIIATVILTSCKKENNEVYGWSQSYSSLEDFHVKNGAKTQVYTINGTSGGSFITPQGTTVTIPPDAFVTSSGSAITGNVTIEFKDLYKKSDMLLSDMQTMQLNGQPLKSAGEFFIKALVDGTPVLVANGKKIIVNQPLALTGNAIDAAMTPFIWMADSSQVGWNPGTDTIVFSAAGYIYQLYQFGAPASAGTWCNSDNSTFFGASPQTILTLHDTGNQPGYMEVFLVFKNINSMVHVYSNGTDYTYDYAPIGLECSVVAVKITNGKLYASFTPITIGADQTVNFSPNEMSIENFKSRLEALN